MLLCAKACADGVDRHDCLLLLCQSGAQALEQILHFVVFCRVHDTLQPACMLWLRGSSNTNQYYL